jgi:hypothetical protein
MHQNKKPIRAIEISKENIYNPQKYDWRRSRSN